MSLTELEQEILAEGARVAAAIKAEVLRVRQSKLVEDLKKLEAEIASLLGIAKPEEQQQEPEPKPKPTKAAKPPAAKKP